jgi:hypothetical protein
MGESKRRSDYRFNFVGETCSRYDPSPCTNCGTVLDAASAYSHKKKPYPGAIAICIRCSHIMAFDEQLRHRELTDAEVLEVAGNQEILHYMRALDLMRKKMGEKQ